MVFPYSLFVFHSCIAFWLSFKWPLSAARVHLSKLSMLAASPIQRGRNQVEASGWKQEHRPARPSSWPLIISTLIVPWQQIGVRITHVPIFYSRSDFSNSLSVYPFLCMMRSSVPIHPVTMFTAKEIPAGWNPRCPFTQPLESANQYARAICNFLSKFCKCSNHHEMVGIKILLDTLNVSINSVFPASNGMAYSRGIYFSCPFGRKQWYTTLTDIWYRFLLFNWTDLHCWYMSVETVTFTLRSMASTSACDDAAAKVALFILLLYIFSFILTNSELHIHRYCASNDKSSGFSSVINYINKISYRR